MQPCQPTREIAAGAFFGGFPPISGGAGHWRITIFYISGVEMAKKQIIFRNEETARIVKAMARHGIPQKTISKIIGVANDTLRKLYIEDFHEGMEQGNGKLLETLFDMAVNQRNVACLIFACKTRLGMKETQALEMTSPDGSMSPDISKMTDARIEKIVKKLTRDI